MYTNPKQQQSRKAMTVGISIAAILLIAAAAWEYPRWEARRDARHALVVARPLITEVTHYFRSHGVFPQYYADIDYSPDDRFCGGQVDDVRFSEDADAAVTLIFLPDGGRNCETGQAIVVPRALANKRLVFTPIPSASATVPGRLDWQISSDEIGETYWPEGVSGR